MKKNLLTLLLSSLAVVSLRADLIFYESFNYTDGPVLTNAPTVWFRHSGAANPADSIVHSKKMEVSTTGGTLSRQDDSHRNFTSFTNTQGIVYFSFTVNCTNLPPVTGSYFAHVYGLETIHTQNLGTNFPGRVFAQAGVLPNTWRLGVAGFSGTVNQKFPVDLATNTDYQVVEEWDPASSFSAFLWVNPISISDPSVQTGDAVSGPTIAAGYGFRQASSFGNFFCTISNLAAATTWDEAATNVWSTNAVAPVVVYSPANATNFPGETVNLSGVAAGQGLASLTYLWLKDGVGLSNPNGNSNVFTLNPAAVSDSGGYQMVATTPYGLSATSAVANLWVTNAPIKPIITQQASNTSVFYHQSAVLHIAAVGPPTLNYQWYYTNGLATGANVSGANTDTLTITDVFTNNGTAGAYRCDVSNPYGTTTGATVTVSVTGPPAVSIAFLRTLVDPVNYIATNSTLRWQATGTVTSFTNLTTGDTSSYYLQDSTGCGINIFTTFGHNFRPNQGDVVTFIGWLSSFNSTLELESDTNDLTTGFTVLSNNLASTPRPKVIPFSIVNNLAFVETNLESSIVILTNVYFGTNAGTTISTTANTTITVTNADAETFTLFFSSQDLDTAGKVLPSFANMVLGPLVQNLGNAVTPRNQGYQINITRFSDIVTNPLSLSISNFSGGRVLTWDAAPYGYSYTIQAAGNVTGPYTNVATGLRFTSTAGTYTDSAAGNPKFYRLTVP